MLEVEGLHAGYGVKQVLRNVSLRVGEREIVALIGHNGAGKTTALRAMMGLSTPSAGHIRFAGRVVRGGEAAVLVRAGMSFVPQGHNIFADLKVDENLDIADARVGQGATVSRSDVLTLFPALAQRGSALASTLSGGQRQMLALACALLRRPRLILLDEPSTGLAPILVDEVFALISLLRERFGLSVLVVDQNARKLMSIADHVVVIKAGEVVFSGAPIELARDDDLWRLF
jgi:branched-chain amino acid transport system ATP-binding protein